MFQSSSQSTRQAHLSSSGDISEIRMVSRRRRNIEYERQWLNGLQPINAQLPQRDMVPDNVALELHDTSNLSSIWTSLIRLFHTCAT